ncbi:MAG: thymidine phosphorylase [Anaerolineales bacterium]|nr:thymidine phosphorylase [Anaerolineales bacterium]
MRAIDIIEKKRDGRELTRDEIEFLVQGFTSDEIPDYQMAAWAMAVFFTGMTPRETTDLTLLIAHSGEILDLTGINKISVDKHSTGGVGDKTSLVVAPLVAACGLAVGKMSGHGLGFTGGTLDKLESIPGFRTDLSTAEFLRQMDSIGLVISGQSADLAPADGKLYALRDVTGTIPSIPLIASSIMSKKIAAGSQAIVLDVKVGKGAFMQDLEEAQQLAELMVSIGERSGRKVKSLLSDMNQPLGHAVGNTLEVIEAIDTLHGKGPKDFLEHCLVISAHMLSLGGIVSTLDDGRMLLQTKLDDGEAWERFKDMVKAQGGDIRYIEETNRLPAAPIAEVVTAAQSGYLSRVDARSVGETAVLLGAGRAKKGEPVDHAVGIEVYRKVGDYLQEGERLFSIHARSEETLVNVRKRLNDATSWSDKPVEPLPLFYGVIPT